MTNHKSSSSTQKDSALTTTSTRFVQEVERQFAAEMGSQLAFTDYEKTLAQHMFLRVDMALKELESKRLDKGQGDRTPFEWSNVNLQKLALDSVHRIGLGLDALIPNHIWPIPYFNKRQKKYDLDLRVGYVGKDFVRRRLAMDEIVDITYELVHKTDTFKPIKKGVSHEIEGYEFSINEPFNRGEVIGGFGYIMYADPKKNKLVIVEPRDFERSKRAAKTNDFWSSNEREMQYKTVVHRVTDKIPIDPQKVNSKSYAYVEAQEVEGFLEAEIAEEANSGPVLELGAGEEPEEAEELSQEEKAEIEAEEAEAVGQDVESGDPQGRLAVNRPGF